MIPEVATTRHTKAVLDTLTVHRPRRYRTQAELMQRMLNPAYPEQRKAAIGERAGKICARIMPHQPAPHGFYAPNDFIASCRYENARNVLYRSLCARLAGKAKS